MLPPQQGADDNSRPLPAQGGARSNAGDGFVLFLAVEDQALRARCRDQRLIVRVGFLATVAFSPLIFLTSRVSQALDADHRVSRRSRPPRTRPRFESCFKAPELTVDCRIVLQWSDPGKAPAGAPNLQTAQRLDLPY